MRKLLMNGKRSAHSSDIRQALLALAAILLQMSQGVCAECAEQGEAHGAGQVPVRSQEAAPQADDSGSDSRTYQAGKPAGSLPGCLHHCCCAAHSAKLLQVISSWQSQPTTLTAHGKQSPWT